MAKPLWATPARQQRLVELFQKYGNRCLLGHYLCSEATHYYADAPYTPVRYVVANDGGKLVPIGTIPDRHCPQTESTPERLHEKRLKDTAATWQADDREERLAEKKRIEQPLPAGEFGQWGSRFDPVQREVFTASRPEYYLLALTFDPVAQRRIAEVRIPSSHIHLLVTVPKGVSAHKRRKLRREGKAVPAAPTVEETCTAAVKHYWTH